MDSFVYLYNAILPGGALAGIIVALIGLAGQRKKADKQHDDVGKKIDGIADQTKAMIDRNNKIGERRTQYEKLDKQQMDALGNLVAAMAKAVQTGNTNGPLTSAINSFDAAQQEVKDARLTYLKEVESAYKEMTEGKEVQ
jgi:uncharacterized protein YoxC